MLINYNPAAKKFLGIFFIYHMRLVQVWVELAKGSWDSYAGLENIIILLLLSPLVSNEIVRLECTITRF